VPLARPLARYFTQGTFDRVDIAAALLGALAAGLVLRRLQRDLAHKHGQ
jgi:Zn-dependent protease